MSNNLTHPKFKAQALKNGNLFELLPHQQLWGLQFQITDNSCWEIVALSSDRKTIVARWVSGQTSIGVLNLSGQRLGAVAVKDVVELFDEF